MKPSVPLLVLLGALSPSLSRGDGAVPMFNNLAAPGAPPNASTGTVPVVDESTGPRRNITTGETISLTLPHAMTLTSDDVSFVTLARSRFSSRFLPSNAEIVYPEKAMAYDAQNAGDVVSRETSLSILGQGAPGSPLNARLRGASANQTLVLLDGRPVEGSALGAADLSEIPLEQIDHIEIVRGGMSALYGPNALAGVINVISKRASYQGAPLSHVSYENASFSRQTYRLDFGSRNGALDYFFFANQQWESGFRDNSDAKQYNIGGNAGYSMGAAGKLLFDAGSFHNNAGIPGPRCDPSDPFCLNGSPFLQTDRFNNKDEKLASTPFARQVTDSNYIRASYLVSLPKDIYLAARLFGQVREADYDNSLDTSTPHFASRDRLEHSKGGELQATLPLGLMVGGSYAHDQEDVLDRIGPDSFSASEENWGLFAQETYHGGKLTLIPSGRYDKNSQFGDTVNPRLQALLDATDWLRFSASAGRSFRAPTIEERMPVPSLNYVGNLDLNPEKAWTYEAGFEIHESSRSARVNYFRANLEDAIQTFISLDPTNSLSPLAAENVGHARRQGLELQIDHVVNSVFRDGWNYTYLESLGTPSGFDHLVPLAYSPRHTVNFYASVMPSRRWTLDTIARYESSRFSGNDQTGNKLGSQFLLDLRLAYQWRQLEVFFGIKDVMNKRYVDQAGFPLPGRTAYGGVKLRLWG